MSKTGKKPYSQCNALFSANYAICLFNPQGTDATIFDGNSKRYINHNFQVGENDAYRIKSHKVQCGDSCDNCKSDSDCANLYPKKYNLNGRTYGGYCQNGEIVLYGCEPTGKEVCMEFDDLNGNNIRDSNEKCLSTSEKKKCDLVKRITTGIECCTSDDCQGAGDFYCNWIDDTHSKCELKAQCQRDSDCGTATKCDRQTMQIKEPYCDAQKQCKERTIKKVDCCSNSDCRDGYYCTSDSECKQTPQTKAVPVRAESSKGRTTTSYADSTPTGLATSQSSSNPLMQNLPGIIVIIICLFIAYALYKSQKKTVIVTDEVEDESPKATQNTKKGAFCDKCGAKVKKSAKFCDNCGEKII